MTKHSRESTYQPPSEHRRIGINDVCALCGNVSAMWVYRRLKDSNFPEPIYIGRRRFWREADVIAWLEAQEVAA